ncbi:hybrid sensor histidine kinase/response regulator [Limnobacter sp.]|uniref:hybrid sensor histidine kinase/response regulator n=1 Tax=Limnobacter sp. TaxID=2003368 RepID=UPI002FDF3152
MKPLLRLKQGVVIALIFLFALTVLATAVVYAINGQRVDMQEQNVVARNISRLSTRMLVLTHNVSSHMNETNVRQWWLLHNSIVDEMGRLQLSDDSSDLIVRLDDRLTEIAELFSGFGLLVAEDESLLDSRRSAMLVDRLISEAEQLAEISYKVADVATEHQEKLTERRRRVVGTFAMLFAINSFLLLVLIRFRVVGPLERIEGVAKEMRGGNLAARCDVPEGDEIGDVAAALDKLAIELNNRIAELTSTTHLLEVAGHMCGVGAWTLNLTNNELIWSKQTYNIVEADFTHQPTLEEVMSLYPGDSSEQLSKAIDEAIQTGNNLNIELEFLTYKGNLIWVHVFGEVTYDGEGPNRQPAMIRGAFQNITERRRVEEEFRQAKELAESASKAKGDFLSNISHEIRTPLNAVVGLTYILKQTQLDTTQREFVEKLENAGRGLIDLVSGVLDVSKIEAGAMELEKRPFSTRQLLDSVADLMTGALADKPIEFVISVASNVPDRLIGDEIKLRQVLVNLAGNAIKFTDSGHVKVSLTVDQLEAGNCMLRFVVQDTGLGMDPTAMKRLFQLFSQADSSISRRFGGTGIGLALSQKLVELMGGTISAVSSPGQGSLFAFSLMLDLDEKIAQTQGSFELGDYDVVVVDGFKPQLDSLMQMMEWYGVAAKGYSSGLDALAAVPGDRPRLYITSQNLSDTSVQEFARAVKTQPVAQAAKVALMVKPGELENIQDLSLGKEFDAVLVKPVSFGALKNALKDVASGRPDRARPVNRQQQPKLAHLGGLTVLAVDDHKLNLMILRKILETHGAKVLLAESGQQAIDLLSKANRSGVDVCLMDIQMPEMDGLQACQFIRTQLEMVDLPVLALTAGVMEADHQLALDVGMNEVLTKPLQVDKVLDAVKRWGFHMDAAVPPG